MCKNKLWNISVGELHLHFFIKFHEILTVFMSFYRILSNTVTTVRFTVNDWPVLAQKVSNTNSFQPILTHFNLVFIAHVDYIITIFKHFTIFLFFFILRAKNWVINKFCELALVSYNECNASFRLHNTICECFTVLRVCTVCTPRFNAKEKQTNT